MADDAADVLMFGTLAADLPVAALADALRRAGISAEARESSLYAGGEYVRVDAMPDVHCSLERLSSAEYLARGDADTLDELAALAGALSAALAALEMRHSLELYADDVLAGHFHHQQPLPG